MSTEPTPDAAAPQRPAPKAEPVTGTKFKPMVMNFQAQAENCAVLVGFSSIGAGIAFATAREIEALLEQDRAVVEVQPYLRGREGEKQLCIRLRSDDEIERLFNELKALVPKEARGRAIGIRTKTGLEFSNYGT